MWNKKKERWRKGEREMVGERERREGGKKGGGGGE